MLSFYTCYIGMLKEPLYSVWQEKKFFLWKPFFVWEHAKVIMATGDKLCEVRRFSRFMETINWLIGQEIGWGFCYGLAWIKINCIEIMGNRTVMFNRKLWEI